MIDEQIAKALWEAGDEKDFKEILIKNNLMELRELGSDLVEHYLRLVGQVLRNAGTPASSWENGIHTEVKKKA